MKEAAFFGQLLFLIIAERQKGIPVRCFLIIAERQKGIPGGYLLIIAERQRGIPEWQKD